MLISLVPLYPNDLWWHIRVGESIVRTGTIPLHDRFSFLSQEVDFVYPGWLGQVLLYYSYASGKSISLSITRNIIITISYALTLVIAARRSKSWALASILTLVGGLCAYFYWHVRPQMHVFPLFVMLLGVLIRFTDGSASWKWLPVVPLVTVLWTNLHGSFLVAPLITAVIAAGSVLDLWRAPQKDARRRALILTGIAGLTALSTLINPWGPGIYALVNAQLSDAPSMIYGPEWHAPTPTGNPLFFFSVLVALLGFSTSPRRTSMVELLTYSALTWQAWNGNRYIIWYSLALPILLAPSLAAFLPPRRTTSAEIPALNLALGVIIGLMALSFQPQSPLREKLPALYQSYVAGEDATPPLLARSTPVEAVEVLRSRHVASPVRLFNETADGSYLIWAWRDGKVFVDTRILPYPLEVWQDYYQIVSGCGYNRLLDHYGITHILLNQPKQPGLAEALPLDPGWRKLWGDSVYALYERSTQPAIEPPCRAAHFATATLP